MRNHVRERNLSITLGVVVASYFCLHAPMTSTYIYKIVSGREVSRTYRMAALIMVMMNNANNPIVYGLMNRNFRNAFFRLLCKNQSTFRPSSQRVLRGIEQHQHQRKPKILPRIVQSIDTTMRTAQSKNNIDAAFTIKLKENQSSSSSSSNNNNISKSNNINNNKNIIKN